MPMTIIVVGTMVTPTDHLHTFWGKEEFAAPMPVFGGLMGVGMLCYSR